MTAGVKRGKSRSLHQTAWLVGDLIEHRRRLKRLCTCIGNQDRARIGVMQALNRHVERVFNPERKDHHWGRRKLARDR
jgi:hypothetical protein